MTTATLPVSAMGKQAAPVRTGWLRRFVDRLVEARTRQAEREVRYYLGRLDPLLTEQRSHKEAVGKDWALPFVRGA